MALLGGISMAAGAAAAEEPPRGEFGETIEVEEVLVDVVVTGPFGLPVTGLGPTDFRVREAGREVAVLAATFLGRPPLATLLDPSPAAPREPAPRLFIVFFDDQRLRGLDAIGVTGRQLAALRELQAWVATLPAEDWVAVASFAMKLRLYLDFSRDRAELSRAIEAAGRGFAAASDAEPRRRRRESPTPSLAALLPSGRKLRDATPTIDRALAQLAHAAAAVPGRKNLLFFSAAYGASARGHAPTVARLNAARIAVVSFDLTPPGILHSLEPGLGLLAEETGGRFFAEVESFAFPLEQTARELDGAYLLAFRRERRPGRSGFAKLEVEVDRPGVRVRVRRGTLPEPEGGG